MQIITKTISKSLTPALKAFRPQKSEVENLVAALRRYLAHIDSKESEENLKTYFMDFLKAVYSPTHAVEQQGDVDFVIRTGGKGTPAAILVESKRKSNKGDMIRKDDINRKAMHELVLYYMRERKAGNTDVQRLMICTEHELFIFDASVFERTFQANLAFRRDFEAWSAGKKSDNTTEFFYREIAAKFIGSSDVEIQATHVDLLEYEPLLGEGQENKDLINLFKILSPYHLLKKQLANDSNSLNKAFYDELLHIIGLEERKEGSKRIIGRADKARRHPGSLLENTISQIRYENAFTSNDTIRQYGASNDEREFNIALELCLTWINRLLFLKLLEGQLLKFHGQDPSFRFLSKEMVPDFNELSDLFFKVLAFSPEERPTAIQTRYAKVPYLNSSLFERTKLEESFRINALSNSLVLSLFKKTVLKDDAGRRSTGSKNTLAYIFEFFDAYDFGAVGGADVREESKTIINAAVLGLIFEKINGYREGAIYTPGYVTMYMARSVIERTVLQAFKQYNKEWILTDIDDLKNNITDRSKASILRLNAVIDRLKICDPAVGSGHFLVACLNELIALKSRIGILADAQGNRLSDYLVEVDNDDLIVFHASTDEVFTYQVKGDGIPKGLQYVQQTLFHEKQKLIENCLFGVDINSNSVRICQLRLWIELLKSAYYRDGMGGQLETLPNIDINIKCGNSLLSRFKLDQNLSDAFSKAGLTVGQYRQLVNDYKNTKQKSLKRDLEQKISAAKTRFRDESLSRLTRRIDEEIEALEHEEGQANLFVLDEDEQRLRSEKLVKIRAKIAVLKGQKDKQLTDKTFMAALEWRFEFPEVLDESGRFVGFDVIIANPPYMRVQEIETTQPDQREFYERDYRTAYGAYDLANLFFELAVRLSKAEGNNNIFIFPHKLFNSANGSPLREYLLNTGAIKHVTHFGANQVFDSALTYTCIALFNTEPADSFKFKRFEIGEEFKTQLTDHSLYVDLRYDHIAAASSLYGSNQWIFFNHSRGFDVFKKIYSQTSSVGREMNAFVGIQTSRDSLYISSVLSELNDGTIKILINPQNSKRPPIPTTEQLVEPDLFKPFIVGKDTQRYKTLCTSKVVFFPYNEDGLVYSLQELSLSFPLTHAFVLQYQKEFSSREDGKAAELAEWYSYIYPKNLTKFEQRKLTSMDICSNHPNIAIDESNLYHGDTAYSYVPNPGANKSIEVYAAILNSELLWWFLKHTGDTLQGDARRMKTNYVSPFPLPETIPLQTQQNISSLVRSLISKKAAGASLLEIEQLETEINTLVYGLYNLSLEEVQVIKDALKSWKSNNVSTSVALKAS
ncbi:putative type IIS restriction/modification enzyme [Agrobacterium fabacearum S56]|uniref:type IIG restriction enzyme/methyltransferase n=1 Tax=Agrobacterium tumefaciens TaxID=358 RepID=UPI0009BB5400|nr:Eco57I restriction-modification methylase domain-containing protein [Agrobacterium tumefaciens]CUX06947.1 putative type IIS restriction/modification enzyme [Agrobacterium fabacearum S56]